MTPEKEAERKAIAEQTKAFLEAGNKITHIPAGMTAEEYNTPFRRTIK